MKAKKRAGGPRGGPIPTAASPRDLQFLQLLLDSVEQAVIATDREGRIAHWNRHAERLYGWPADEVTGRDVCEVLLPPGARERARALMADSMRGERSAAQRHEWTLQRRDGVSVVVHAKATPIVDPLGAVIGIVGVSWDISETRRLESELHELELRLQVMAEQLPMYVWATDADLRIVWNAGAAFRRFPGDPSTAIGKTIAEVVQQRGGQPVAVEAHERALAGDTVPYEGGGAGRVMRAVVQPVRDKQGRITGTVGVALDVTDQKRVESELSEKREEIQALSGRILLAQEAERRALARELHDDLGQFLTAIRLNLEGARNADAAHRASNITACVRLVDQAIDQARRLALDLRPYVLDDLGLVAALRSFIKRQAQQARYAAKFSVDGLDARLSTALETCSFRLVQEALTNVARHASAKTVDVHLRATAAELNIRVRDDGKGFDVERARSAAAHGASLGLLSMHERVALCGGTLDITSSPGQGTLLEARLPVTWGKP